MTLPSPASTARVVDDPFELVGETPLVRLRHASDTTNRSVWLKLEHLNPTSSVKDREAGRALRAHPSGELVVATTGNLGIALAARCAREGRKLAVVMPRGMSLERRATLRAYEVELVLSPADGGLDGAMRVASALARERGATFVDPFELATSAALALGDEILADMAGLRIDAVVSTVGSGGTLRGMATAIRAAHPNVRIVAVEAASSPVLSRSLAGPSKIQGAVNSRAARAVVANAFDEIIGVSDDDAYRAKSLLAHREGVLAGMSTGANVAAAIEVARRMPAGANVVTLQCDTGERYFSLEEFFAHAS